MVVAELMRNKVRTVGISDTLVDAIAAMLDAQVSALPVLDTHGKPVGVVTSREILRASLYGGGSRGPDLIPIEEFIAPWPPAVDPDTAVDEAARMMSYLDLKRLFVVDGEALVGVVSQTDIVDAVATARCASST
jgi:CBS domain-containing protein